MQQKSTSLNMTQGDPAKLLIVFAIPMFIGGLFQLMYNMVDTIVVGRYVSIEALAAIGATSSTMMFFMQMGGGMTNALSVIVSQAEGARQEARLKKAISHALYLVLFSGITLGLIAFFGARPFMRLLGTPENIIDDSVKYIRIVGGLTIALMSYNGVAAVLRAIGDSRTPLYFLVICSLLNVVLDLLFVLALNSGVAGVAWATILSQCVSAVLCGVYMLKKYPRLRPDAAAWRFDREMIREYVRIGVPMCLQSATLCVGMFVITAVINSYGSDTVAAFTIGSKVEQLATVSFSNLAFSFSVYAGQNFGAKRYDRIKEGLRKGLMIVCSLALLSTLVIELFAPRLALVFMDEGNEAVFERAVAMIRIEAALLIALGSIWSLNSCLRGIGAVRVTLLSSIVELVCKIGLSLLLPIFWGYIGIWIAAPSGWVLGMIPSVIFLSWWYKAPEERSAGLNAGKRGKKKAA